MARIRKVEIENFRGIKLLAWCPSAGVNCLIGPGDSAKSTVLDAIDLCLGARRGVTFTDADFYQLNVENPIRIALTIGDLDDGLKSLDAYGLYVRGFDAHSGAIEDEPAQGAETVLTLQLSVESDLEGSWSLVSERAEEQGQSRNLSWNDRIRLAPTRIGATADYHLGWRRGSVLNQLSDERVEGTAALAKAARDARSAFGDEVKGQLSETLGAVTATAQDLGIDIGEDLRAMLDAGSVSFSGGTIALHDEEGVPLRRLGVGSTRLLIAGLQRRAAARASIILMDELEYGLEPHRIIRLLGSLGAKEQTHPLQVFATTHSPVALRELAGSQLYVMRATPDGHNVLRAGTSDDVQSSLRAFPDAYLAATVVVCEGASEVGLIRGLDQFRSSNGYASIAACGVALVDSGGGSADTPFNRASAFCSLGYRTAVVRDDDKPPTEELEAAFIDQGGKVVAWGQGRALEDELFQSLSQDVVVKLIDRAIELHGEELIREHIRSSSEGAKDLDGIRFELLDEGVSQESRQVLGKAAKGKKAAWFKTVTRMEDIARDLVGPALANADPAFVDRVNELFAWASNGKP